MSKNFYIPLPSPSTVIHPLICMNLVYCILAFSFSHIYIILNWYLYISITNLNSDTKMI